MKWTTVHINNWFANYSYVGRILLLVYRIITGVEKSRATDCPRDCILYGGAEYLQLRSMEPASCD